MRRMLTGAFLVLSSAAASAGTVVIDTGIEDTWLNIDNPTTNYGSSADMHLQYEGGTPDRQVYYIDLSAYDGVTVSSAVFEVYAYSIGVSGTGTITVEANQILTSWNEATATYNSPWSTPGMAADTDYSSAVAATVTVDAVGYFSLDITTLVQTWVTTPSTNLGLVLRGPGRTGDGHLRTWTSEGTDKPRLNLTFTGNSSPTAVITATQPTVEVGQDPGLSGTSSTDPDLDTLSYSWDFDDGDGIGVDSTDPAPSTTYPAAGTYTVTLTVDDGNGGTDTTTIEIEVYAESITTVVVDSSMIVDNWISEDFLSVNFGADEMVHLQALTADYQLYGFDLSGIPAGANMIQADFRVYAYEVPAATVVEAHKLNVTWGEMTSTWSSPWSTPGLASPTDYDSAVAASTTIGAVGYMTFDIASLVQGWVDAPATNNGLLLDAVSGGHIKTYTTETTEILKPDLTIKYTSGTGNAPPQAVINVSSATVVVGEDPGFDGSSSTDSDGAIVSYEWDFDYDGVTFDVEATGPTRSHPYALPGTYTVALRVTDDGTPPASDLATVEITVLQGEAPVIWVTSATLAGVTSDDSVAPIFLWADGALVVVDPGTGAFTYELEALAFPASVTFVGYDPSGNSATLVVSVDE